jgi:hypothetical protein
MDLSVIVFIKLAASGEQNSAPWRSKSISVVQQQTRGVLLEV